MREKYALQSKKMQIDIRDTTVESTWHTHQQQTSLRLYKDGKLQIVLREGEYDEEEVYKELSESISLGRTYSVSLERNRQENLICEFQKYDQGAIVHILENVMQELRENFPSLSLIGDFCCDHRKISMQNEQTLYLNFEDRLLHGSFSLRCGEKTEDPAFFSLVFRNIDRKNIYAAFAEYCRAYLNPLRIESGKEYPVLFSTGNPTPLRKLEKDLQPDMFQSGMASLSGTAGQQIFHKDFTLYASRAPEDAKIRSRQILPFFDSEGSVNPLHRKALIEEGRVLTPYTCKQTAEKYELEKTASASASPEGYPYASAEGLCIKPSDRNLKTLLHGQRGIFISDIREDAFDEKGGFLLRSQSTFIHDGEHLIGRLPSLRLSSDLFSMYGKKYLGVSSDHFLHSDVDRALLLIMQTEEYSKEASCGTSGK